MPFLRKPPFTCLWFVLIFSVAANAQMRQVHIESDDNESIKKISFYSASQGFVGFRNWIGFTTDSGRTFTKKLITFGNVNYNGYSVNLTFGFGISGVQAFAQNNILVYGDYGLVPAILSSTDGGNTFKLIYHSQYSPFQLSTGITDMVFPGNGSTGYAIDADRILKSTNQGLSWTTVYTSANSFFEKVIAPDASNAFVLSSYMETNKLVKTVNGGANWQTVVKPAVPEAKLISAYFLNASEGWINVAGSENNRYLFKTSNGGNSWTQINDPEATPFECSKMIFVSSTTGYALTKLYEVSKTLDGGITWEPLQRDLDFNYLFYPHNDLFCLSATQLWAGGWYGLLEMSTNGGGTPLPKAYFKIDTAGVKSTGIVHLLNYSKPGYSYQWFLNNVQIGTQYHASYLHDIFNSIDTITLIVSNGLKSDTTVKTQRFGQTVIINSFSPTIGITGTTITIKGSGFAGLTSVLFGGVPANNLKFISWEEITADVGSGASGNVTVYANGGIARLGGFTYYPPPVIDLPVFISDSIFCKTGSATVSLQNTEPNVRYELVDSLNNSFGFVNSNGGNVLFQTGSISRTGNYRIKASRLNVSLSRLFTKTIFLLAEHPAARFTAIPLNAAPGEKVVYTNQSTDASVFNWTFYQDASTASSNQRNPALISYAAAGQKSLQLIGTSNYGCSDTLLSDAAYVYSKQLPELSCYVRNIDDTPRITPDGFSAAMNRISLAHDNGYFVSGHGNYPWLKSSAGKSKKYLADRVAYLAKYTTDGIFSWSMSLSNNNRFYDAKADEAGNIYVTGSCATNGFLSLANGDSIRISITASDDPSSSTPPRNGFIIKLDSTGRYLWHTILSYPGAPNKNGGVPTSIEIKGNQVAVAGTFNSALAYVRNGIAQQLFSLPNEDNDFVIRIRPDGSLVWSVHFESTARHGLRRLSGLGIDDAKNYYVCGYYEENITIHDAGNVNSVTYSGSYGNIGSYLLKFDSTGRLIRKANLVNNFASGRCKIEGMVTAGDGNCYVTGFAVLNGSFEYFSVLNSDNSNSRVTLSGYFLIRFDAECVYKWSAGSWKSFYGVGNAVCLKGNDVCTIGTFNEGGTDPQLFKFTSTNLQDAYQQCYPTELFIAMYDTTGVLKSVRNSGQNSGGYFEPNNITADKKGHLLISGTANQTYYWISDRDFFGSNLPTNEKDAFFAKLNPDFCYPNNVPNAALGPDTAYCVPLYSDGGIEIGPEAQPGCQYAWSSSDNSYFSNGSSRVRVTPSGQTRYVLTVIGPHGVIARDSITISTAPVGIKADPAGDFSICKGDSVAIGPLLGDPSECTWTSSPPGFHSNAINPVVRPDATTTYYVQQDIGAAHCILYDTLEVRVLPDTGNCHPVAQKVCNYNGLMIVSHLKGSSYLWQADWGVGYYDLEGETSDTLDLSQWYPQNSKYRCKVNGNYGEEHLVLLQNTWTGAADNQWENPLNWSCGKVPLERANVLIPSGNVVINSSVLLWSLTVVAGATVTVKPGAEVILIHYVNNF